MNNITRRELLLSLPALALAPRAFTQAARPPIPVKTLNHFALAVSDVKRSLDFYQGLFGMPIQTRQGPTVILRIGNGPQFMAIGPAGSNPPAISSHVCMTVDKFNPDQLVGLLAQRGSTKTDDSDPGLRAGLMKVRAAGAVPRTAAPRKGLPSFFLEIRTASWFNCRTRRIAAEQARWETFVWQILNPRPGRDCLR
jgi:catechol 2,3-dioxygenase-like lactoylglutathione lyase family enzyme